MPPLLRSLPPMRLVVRVIFRLRRSLRTPNRGSPRRRRLRSPRGPTSTTRARRFRSSKASQSGRATTWCAGSKSARRSSKRSNLSARQFPSATNSSRASEFRTSRARWASSSRSCGRLENPDRAKLLDSVAAMDPAKLAYVAASLKEFNDAPIEQRQAWGAVGPTSQPSTPTDPRYEKLAANQQILENSLLTARAEARSNDHLERLAVLAPGSQGVGSRSSRRHGPLQRGRGQRNPAASTARVHGSDRAAASLPGNYEADQRAARYRSRLGCRSPGRGNADTRTAAGDLSDFTRYAPAAASRRPTPGQTRVPRTSRTAQQQLS